MHRPRPPLSCSPNSNQTPPPDPAQAFNLSNAAGEIRCRRVESRGGLEARV